MSFKTTILPEKMLRMISAAERQKMGKSAMLSSEAQAKIDAKSEKVLQNQIRLHRFYEDAVLFSVNPRTVRKRALPVVGLTSICLFVGARFISRRRGRTAKSLTTNRRCIAT